MHNIYKCAFIYIIAHIYTVCALHIDIHNIYIYLNIYTEAYNIEGS